MVLEMCYKALYNAMTRREHERNENRRMIEKQQRIELITRNMKEQGANSEQLAEVSKHFQDNDIFIRSMKINCSI
jgi:DNA-directed RNA polymerase III subunit RPC3